MPMVVIGTHLKPTGDEQSAGSMRVASASWSSVVERVDSSVVMSLNSVGILVENPWREPDRSESVLERVA